MSLATFNWSGVGRIEQAEFIKSPNCDARPPQTLIDLLVIHAISLPPNEYGGGFVEQLFTNRLSADEHPYFKTIVDMRVSAHFFVRRNGALVQFVETYKRAWHAGESEYQGRKRVNDFSIGIELEGCDEDEFTAAQYKILSNLINTLMQEYPMLSTDKIVGHSDIAPQRKSDPGPKFDWQRLRILLVK